MAAHSLQCHFSGRGPHHHCCGLCCGDAHDLGESNNLIDITQLLLLRNESNTANVYFRCVKPIECYTVTSNVSCMYRVVSKMSIGFTHLK